jgi:VanZ family protein
LLSLAYPRFWSAVGWLLVAGVVVGSLLPGPTVAEFTFSVNDKVMHSSAYCLLMVWFSGLYRRSFYWAIGAVLLGLGVGLDLLQSLTRTRSVDWRDMVANASGIALGLVLAFYVVGGWCQRLERRLLS